MQKYGPVTSLWPAKVELKSDGAMPQIPEIWEWTDSHTKRQLLLLFEEMDLAAFQRWRTGKEYPENCKVVKLVHWTRSNGGRYQETQDGAQWKEYDANNNEIRCLACTWRDCPKGEVNLREDGTLNRVIITGTRCELDIETSKTNTVFVGYETFEEKGVWNYDEEEYWKY